MGPSDGPQVVNVLSSEEQPNGLDLTAQIGSGPLVLSCLGGFCRVDLFGGQQKNKRKNGATKMDGHNNSTAKWLFEIIRNQLSSWPDIIRIVYVICSFRMIINIYFQYIYDVRLARIQHYKINGHIGYDTSNSDLSVSKRDKKSHPNMTELADELERTKLILISVGAPFLDASFAIECAYVFILLISWIVYMNPQAYFHLFRPFDYSLIRAILDWKHERESLVKLIDLEVNKFLVSSFNYSAVCVKKLYSFTSPCIESNNRPVLDNHLAKKIQKNVDSLARRHASNVILLRELVGHDKLMPQNRSPVWLAKVSHYYCLFTVTSVIFIICFAITCLFLLPIAYGFSIRSDKMDIIVAIEMIIITIFAAISGVFYISIILTTCADQSKLVGCLRLQIDQFIVLSHLRFLKIWDSTAACSPHHNLRLSLPILTKITSSRSSQHEIRVEQIKRSAVQVLAAAADSSRMNHDLFKLVLDYKIFVAQLKSMQNSFGFIAFQSLLVAFIMPVTGRLHVPYLDEKVKLLTVLVSVVFMAFSDLCMIPVCHLYSRCLDLYKSLSSLLAHVVHVTSEEGELTDDTRTIYDEHLTWIIRKELNHPDQLRVQFATIGLGLLFTYQNLIRVHFWFGLIVLSIVFDTNNVPGGQEAFGSIFSDPLGIFEQI